MAFKGESDDTRSSLSYKLKRLLRFRAKNVLCTDPFVKEDPNLDPLEAVIDQSDVLIVGAPHEMYRSIDTSKPIIDIWNVRQMGVKV